MRGIELLGVRGLTQNLKYIENLNVPSEKYLKILVRDSYIDNVWQRKGIGTSNFIATVSGFGYGWDCVKLEYPFTENSTISKFRADLLNKNRVSKISIGRGPSGDNGDFFGTIFVKFSTPVTIYGYFEAVSVTVVDEQDTTIWRTLSSPEIGENLF